VLVEFGAVLERNAPDVALRVAEAKAISPSRSRRLRIETSDVIEDPNFFVGAVDGQFVFAVDGEREAMELVAGISVLPPVRRFGEQTQHDTVRALEHDVLGRTRRRFRPAELAIEGRHPTDISADERDRTDPVR
jgi:hypothetical protein